MKLKKNLMSALGHHSGGFGLKNLRCQNTGVLAVATHSSCLRLFMLSISLVVFVV